MDSWRDQFGSPPPKYTSLEFMRKALCYEAQVKAFGGHSKAVQKVFKASLKTVQNHQSKSSTGVMISETGKANALHSSDYNVALLSTDQGSRSIATMENSSVADTPIQSSATSKLRRRPPTIPIPRPSVLSVRAGTHLVREWNGRTYQVEALDKGFRLDGKTYRSLSAIAKKITGAHWSGPRFFGLE